MNLLIVVAGGVALNNTEIIKKENIYKSSGCCDSLRFSHINVVECFS